MYRLVIEKVATLQELETFWSLDDLVLFNEALDAKAYAEYVHSKRK